MKKILHLVTVFSTVTPGTAVQPTDYETIVLDDAPVGYWQFESLQDDILTDSSGNQKDGAAHGVVLTADGIYGFAGMFDGLSTYVDLAGAWGGGSEASVEAWIKISDPTADLAAILETPNREFVGFHLTQPGTSALSVFYTVGAQINLDSAEQSADGLWHHYVFQINPVRISLYVDGIEQYGRDHNRGETIGTTNSLMIGRGYQNQRYLRGLIDEVAIYDYSLSPEQIQDHYQAVFPPCLADVSEDGIVDNGDIIVFVDFIFAADPRADINGDGINDNGDIIAFVEAFLAGC